MRLSAMAAHKIGEAALRIDYRYAELISQRKDREAMALRVEVAFTGLAKSMMGALPWVFGKTLLGAIDDAFRRDVLIEANAELAHDASGSLRRILVPVLIVSSDHDFAFPLSTTKEMASLIQHATLKVYQGGHTSAFLGKRVVQDVREFTRLPAHAEYR